MRASGGTAEGTAGHWPPPGEAVETLGTVRAEARRERLIDMEMRVRPYRAACFAILCLALLFGGQENGWLWMIPLCVGFAGFAVADRFIERSRRPAAWVAAAWALTPLLVAGAVPVTGGVESPALVWMALPAVTLGARFEPRGMVVGTAFILGVFLFCTFGLEPDRAMEERPTLVAIGSLILCTVILSAALAESDRAHRRRSTLDPLTGLLNRSALEQRLAEIDGQPCGEEDGTSHALLLCDVDHFKSVNDELGHATGDAVLRDVAYTMRAALRAGDSIYRVGGEEILVILPGAGREEAIRIAERLRRQVRDRRPAGVQVTISIGAAVTPPGTLDSDELVARADAALYAAKEGGRDTVSVAA